jgi:UPF0148 protein
VTSSAKLLAELIRRGAVLLKEPCPKCGGLMVKYKERELCPSCSNIESIDRIDSVFPSYDSIDHSLSELIYRRIHNISEKLLKVKSVDDERDLIELLLKYYQLLKEIAETKRKEERSSK